MEIKLKALAITESSMGHKTYGLKMRQYFMSRLHHIDIYYDSENKDIFARIVNKLLNFRLPSKFICDRNLDFFRFRAQVGYSFLTRGLIDRKLKEADYDVLYIHTQALSLLSLDIIARIPTVVSLDMTNLQASLEANRSYQWTYKPNIWLEHKVYAKSAKILTWTEWARQSVINDYGVHPDKVIHLPPGVDTKLVTFTNRELKRELKTKQDLYHLLFMGGDFKRKGGEDILDVFLDKFSERAVLHIVTLGQVDCEHPNVHVYNNIQAYTPEWFELYQQADAFVMPSYAEAFGLVFIEAMASGLPVIASRLVQTTEIVRDGETGFLVPAGDRKALANRIQTLIDNPSLGLAMGKRAREIAETEFDSDKNFQKLESIFRELSNT